MMLVGTIYPLVAQPLANAGIPGIPRILWSYLTTAELVSNKPSADPE